MDPDGPKSDPEHCLATETGDDHLGGPGNGGVGEDLGDDDGKVVLHAANDCHAQVVRRVLQNHHLHITPQQSVNVADPRHFGRDPDPGIHASALNNGSGSCYFRH